MIDKLLVATLADRTRFKALSKQVPMGEMGTSTEWLIKAFGTFFDRNPEARQVDYDVLRTMARLKLENQESAPVLTLILQLQPGHRPKHIVVNLTRFRVTVKERSECLDKPLG